VVEAMETDAAGTSRGEDERMIGAHHEWRDGPRGAETNGPGLAADGGQPAGELQLQEITLSGGAQALR